MKKLTKIISAMLTAVMLLSLFAVPAVAYADGGECGNGVTWSFKDGVLTISGSGGMDDYYSCSPETLPPWSHLPVTRIVVEEGVAYLGVKAFSCFNVDDVVSISLPMSLKGIGRGALGNNLDAISFPEGNESFKIIDGCLINNNKLLLGCGTSVIPSDGSVKSIYEGAFAGCEELSEIVIPYSVKTICNGAFANCKNLISVTLSEGIVCIGSEAFKNCCNLKSINLPEGLETIGYYAFSGCNSLEELTIPASYKANDAYPFGYSTRTTLIVFAGSDAQRVAEYFGYGYELIAKAGDVDGDGEVTVSDALAVLRMAAKLAEPTKSTGASYDFDGDGHVSVSDALAILRVAAKLADSL